MNWSDPTGNNPATFGDLEVVFYNVVSVIIGFAGIVFFGLIIFAGFQFITAGGEPAQLEAAKKTLTNAVMGLVLVVISFLIIVTISWFTGSQVTTFIPTR